MLALSLVGSDETLIAERLDLNVPSSPLPALTEDFIRVLREAEFLFGYLLTPTTIEVVRHGYIAPLDG